MKFLALTPAYPPYNAAMTPVVERFIDALGMQGYIVGESSLLFKSDDEIRTVSDFKVDPLRYRLLDWEMRIVTKLTGHFWPDVWREWSSKAFSMALRVIENSDEELVLVSFSSPVSAHLQAMKLKKLFPQIRWIAYIADPLVDGVMYSQSSMHYRRIIRNCEESIILNADATVTLSRVHYDYLKEAHRGGEIHYIPHCHAPDPPISRGLQPTDYKQHVAHFGNIYPPRTILPFVDALNSSGLAGSFRFSYFGSVPETEKDIALGCSPLSFYTALPYDDFVRSIREMDGLILIESVDTSSKMPLPSKLIEYIGANRPVFGFCLPGSEGQRICTEMGFSVADITSKADCRMKFNLFLSDLQTVNYTTDCFSSTVGFYSPERTQTAVRKLLNDLRII